MTRMMMLLFYCSHVRVLTYFKRSSCFSAEACKKAWKMLEGERRKLRMCNRITSPLFVSTIWRQFIALSIIGASKTYTGFVQPQTLNLTEEKKSFQTNTFLVHEKFMRSDIKNVFLLSCCAPSALLLYLRAFFVFFCWCFAGTSPASSSSSSSSCESKEAEIMRGQEVSTFSFSCSYSLSSSS